MKTKIWLPLVLCFTACSGEVADEVVVLTKADSVLEESQKLHETTKIILKKTDQRTDSVLMRVAEDVNKIQQLNALLSKENKSLKIGAKVQQLIVVHDTILITEKKNFWGKTKITKDSMSSVVSEVFVVPDTTHQK